MSPVFPVCLLYSWKSRDLSGKSSYTKSTGSGCGGEVKTADLRKLADAYYGLPENHLWMFTACFLPQLWNKPEGALSGVLLVMLILCY